MSRFGRRTFLTSSAGVAAGAAVAGAARPPGTAAASVARRVGAAATLRPGRLTVNGLVEPVGIDPDDCSFAWTLQASGRGAAQRAARIVVRRTDPGHGGLVWDSGTMASARQAFVTYAGPALAADAAYEWTVQVEGADPGWGPVSGPARFTTGLRAGDWGSAVWLIPAAGPAGPDRVTYLRSEFTPPAGTLVRAPRPTSRPPTPTGSTWTTGPSTPGPASPIPTSSTCAPST